MIDCTRALVGANIIVSKRRGTSLNQSSCSPHAMRMAISMMLRI